MEPKRDPAPSTDGSPDAGSGALDTTGNDVPSGAATTSVGSSGNHGTATRPPEAPKPQEH